MAPADGHCYHLFKAWGGWVCIRADNDGLVGLSLPASRERALQQAGDARHCPDHPVLAQARAQVLQYLAGERRAFDLPCHLVGLTAFQRAVLEAAAAIPYGQVRSYQWVAGQAGRPRAARAAGQALHRNPLPLVIPCHRVMGAAGNLVGFGSGLEMKRQLLALECLQAGSPRPWRE